MDNNSKKVMFSSKTVEWGTPRDFYEKLNKKYSFTLDACASANNAKCENYFTLAQDGLRQDWSGHTVFCNPPYGKEIKAWVRKAYIESQKDDTEVILLIPARTDTDYFHKYCMKAASVYFVKGRLKFESEDGKASNSAPFPSIVVHFKSGSSGNPDMLGL